MPTVVMILPLVVSLLQPKISPGDLHDEFEEYLRLRMISQVELVI